MSPNFLPEFVLLLTIFGLLISEVSYSGEDIRFTVGITFLGLASAFAFSLRGFMSPETHMVAGFYLRDSAGSGFQMMAQCIVALGLGYGLFSGEIPRSRRTEFCALGVALSLALCLLSTTGHFIIIFFELQFLGVVSYLLASIRHTDQSAIESAWKMMVPNVITSALFLLALALFSSGNAGATDLAALKSALLAHPPQQGFVALALLIFSVLYFSGVFPFHAWVVDVLDGAPGPSALMLVSALPAVGFIVCYRILQASADFIWIENINKLLQMTGLITMIFGGLLALRQKKIRRMLGYLALIQLGAWPTLLAPFEARTLPYFLVSQIVLTISLFGVLVGWSRFRTLEDLKGSFAQNPIDSVCVFLFWASLVCIPPGPGFFSVYRMIERAADQKLFFLVGIMAFALFLGALTFARVTPVATRSSHSGQENAAVDGNIRLFTLGLLVPFFCVVIFGQPILEALSSGLKIILW